MHIGAELVKAWLAMASPHICATHHALRWLLRVLQTQVCLEMGPDLVLVVSHECLQSAHRYRSRSNVHLFWIVSSRRSLTFVPRIEARDVFGQRGSIQGSRIFVP